MTNNTSMAKANIGFLQGTADKIDRVLKSEAAENMSTEDMIDEFAALRDRIRTHVANQQPDSKGDYLLDKAESLLYTPVC